MIYCTVFNFKHYQFSFLCIIFIRLPQVCAYTHMHAHTHKLLRLKVIRGVNTDGVMRRKKIEDRGSFVMG